MDRRAIVWFRRDLRVADHAALAAAARRAEGGVIGVFAITPKQWKAHDEAACKIWFWMAHLRSLRDRLDALNVPLLIVHAETYADLPQVMLQVAQQHKCQELHFNDEYEVNERRRDEEVRALLESRGIEVFNHSDHYILPPGAVRTQSDDWYSVFTPFSRRWKAVLAERGLEVLDQPRKQSPLEIGASEIPGEIDGFDEPADSLKERWPIGESSAKKRLSTFIRQRIEQYHERRDFPAEDGTSVISPYLNAGVVSPRACFAAASDALEAQGGRRGKTKNGHDKWMDELIWREFYGHLIAAYPRLSMHQPFQLKTTKLRWNENEGQFRKWCNGETGFPFVDAAMRQLNATGWMHNRVRMVVAMFLTKDLWLDWRLGERYFMRHLIDGDLASNNGGWQWSASTGTDAAPYFRIYNPTTQGERYDPEAIFIRRWVPELADLDVKDALDPSRLPGLLRSQVEYPEPIVDHGKAREHAISAFKALS